MDSHRVQAAGAAGIVTIAGVEFDNNFYDREVDVLYLHVGEPASAVDFGATAEGDAIRYGPGGRLVGLTILNAKLRLEEDGRIGITLPEHAVAVSDFGDLPE
jgi:uncharacterized protein YuzE